MSDRDHELRRIRAEMGQGEVFIFCDDASHPRRAAIDTFQRIPGIGWTLVLDRAENTDGSLGNTVRSAVGMSPLVPSSSETTLSAKEGGFRHRFRLSCKKWGCRRRVVEARGEKLFPVLDAIVAAGVSEVPLSLIAARLAEQERTRD